MTTALAGDICPACLRQMGLCERHALHVLPQLAVNKGWLKLIGNAEIEQKQRQITDAPLPESPESLAHTKRKQTARLTAKARRANKSKRGYVGLYLAIQGRKRAGNSR